MLPRLQEGSGTGFSLCCSSEVRQIQETAYIEAPLLPQAHAMGIRTALGTGSELTHTGCLLRDGCSVKALGKLASPLIHFPQLKTGAGSCHAPGFSLFCPAMPVQMLGGLPSSLRAQPPLSHISNQWSITLSQTFCKQSTSHHRGRCWAFLQPLRTTC